MLTKYVFTATHADTHTDSVTVSVCVWWTHTDRFTNMHCTVLIQIHVHTHLTILENSRAILNQNCMNSLKSWHNLPVEGCWVLTDASRIVQWTIRGSHVNLHIFSQRILFRTRPQLAAAIWVSLESSSWFIMASAAGSRRDFPSLIWMTS